MIEFAQYAAAKERCARKAVIDRLTTIEELPASRDLTSIGNAWTRDLIAIGNSWTRDHFAGSFYLSPLPSDLPAISQVFVQSREGNTGADNPADLGGGDTDLHLIYEGLSRVAADGVLAGASTARGNVFFSIWHPELVALRASLGLPRHPAQIVISADGHIDLDHTLLFNVPETPVFVPAGDRCVDRCRVHLQSRPWVTVIPLTTGDVRSALRALRTCGMNRISCVGGRRTATTLVDAGVVQDLYLTTTERSAGEAGTPFYTGKREFRRAIIVRKQSPPRSAFPIMFEHTVVEPRVSNERAPA